MPKKNILLITAHADDHIIAAGTVFKLQDQGHEVYELILTSSNEGRDYRNPEGRYDVASLRDSEFSEASKFLGTKQVWRFEQDDLDLKYSKDLVFKAVKVIREVQPEVGIIMARYDWHPDHQAAYDIGAMAFKMAATGIKPELGDHHRTPIVLAAEGMLPIQPNIFVDITDYYQKKAELFSIYESQASSKALGFTEGLAKVRGYHVRRVGSMMAEAFTTDPTSPIILFD